MSGAGPEERGGSGGISAGILTRVRRRILAWSRRSRGDSTVPGEGSIPRAVRGLLTYAAKFIIGAIIRHMAKPIAVETHGVGAIVGEMPKAVTSPTVLRLII